MAKKEKFATKIEISDLNYFRQRVLRDLGRVDEVDSVERKLMRYSGSLKHLRQLEIMIESCLEQYKVEKELWQQRSTEPPTKQ